MFDSIIAYNNGDYVASLGGYANEQDTVRDDLPGGQTGEGPGAHSPRHRQQERPLSWIMQQAWKLSRMKISSFPGVEDL